MRGIMEWLRRRWWDRQEDDRVGDHFTTTITEGMADAQQAKAEAEINKGKAEKLRRESAEARQELEEDGFAKWLFQDAPRLRRRES